MRVSRGLPGVYLELTSFIEGQSSPWTRWDVLVTEKGYCCFDACKWRLNIGNGAMP